jgi:hypothetical protein
MISVAPECQQRRRRAFFVIAEIMGRPDKPDDDDQDGMAELLA